MASYIVHFREEGSDCGYYGITTIEANSKKHAFMKFKNQTLQNRYKITDICENIEPYLGVYSSALYNAYITLADTISVASDDNNAYITSAAIASSNTTNTFDNIGGIRLDNFYYISDISGR